VAAESDAIRSDDAADRRAAADVRRIERQELTVRREAIAEVVHAGAGAHGHREVLGHVVDDPGDASGLEGDVGLAERPEMILRSAAADADGTALARTGTQDLGTPFGRVGVLNARH
jgi:hypothetical protein